MSNNRTGNEIANPSQSTNSPFGYFSSFDHVSRLFNTGVSLHNTVAVIPGNHDLWNTDGMARSENRWSYLLPKAVRERGFL